MTTDFRALCVDLLRELDHASAWDYRQALKDQARAALAEPEPSTDRPDRLRVGDVWEFLVEVNVKGKRKPVDKLLQWEVVGWHDGQYAWELQSLDGEHRTYLMEFAPCYEEMRFVRSNEPQAQ